MSVLLLVTCILLAVGALMGLTTLDMFMLTAPGGVLYRGLGFSIYSPLENIAGVESFVIWTPHDQLLVGGLLPLPQPALHPSWLLRVPMESG